jgi:hypothetical protein
MNPTPKPRQYSKDYYLCVYLALFFPPIPSPGFAVTQFVEALRYYKLEVRFRILSLEFFIDLILRAALWTWGRISF